MAKIDKLNPYAYRIETAQTQVRDVIKQAFLWRKDFDETTSELIRVINSAASDIGIETLKSDCAISLYLFARNQKRIWSSMGLTPEITRNLGAYSAKGFACDKTLDQNLYNEYRKLQPQIMSTGVPLQSYYKHTWEKLVKPTLNALAEDRAIDQNDYTGRNRLMYKDISKKEYTRYKGMAKKIYKEYAEYSLSHNRAFYPSRTEI